MDFVEHQFGTHIKTICSDNGTEFMCMSAFFREKGILHETLCVGTLQQNGRTERKHRHILNVARALRFQSSLPLDFWGKCILTAAYLINRTLTPLLDGKTPFECLYGRPPPLNHLRVFSYLCFAHNQNHKVINLPLGVFLGYILAILTERNVGVFLIRKQEKYLFHVMLYFVKQSSHSHWMMLTPKSLRR